MERRKTEAILGPEQYSLECWVSGCQNVMDRGQPCIRVGCNFAFVVSSHVPWGQNTTKREQT